MDAPNMRPRKMTLSEYEAATLHREAESIRELSNSMPEQQATDRTRQGTAQYLANGLEKTGHYLVVAENSSGEVVGNAWIRPDPREACGPTDSAWLYDINVFAPFRRRGYGSAILACAEDLVARAGGSRLGLNVAGDNAAAIACIAAMATKSRRCSSARTCTPGSAEPPTRYHDPARSSTNQRKREGQMKAHHR